MTSSAQRMERWDRVGVEVERWPRRWRTGAADWSCVVVWIWVWVVVDGVWVWVTLWVEEGLGWGLDISEK